jgi:hypothetical protein
VRTGAASGLVVVDVDPAHGGDAALERLIAQHGSLPQTLTVLTGSGGRHFYFSHPGRTVRNSAGTMGAGLDIRGDGGYVVAPPSRHITGGVYQWADSGCLAALPSWLEQPRPQPVPLRDEVMHPRRQADSSAWANQALWGELARVRQSQPGRRNNDLNRAAFALGQLVASGHLDAEIVHDLLVEAGLAVGLGDREVAATVHSGLEAGWRHPRHPVGRGDASVQPTARDFDLRTIDIPGPASTPRDRGCDAASPLVP